eukprot:g29.t1
MLHSVFLSVIISALAISQPCKADDTFDAWLTSQHISRDALKIKDSLPEFGAEHVMRKGCVLTKDVPNDGLLAKMPLNTIITLATALRSPVGEKLRNETRISMAADVLLSIFLMNERYNSTSIWKGYLESIPQKKAQDFDTTLMYSEDELKEFQSSSVIFQTLQRLQLVRQEFGALESILCPATLNEDGSPQVDSNNQIVRVCDAPFTKETMNFDNYLWARSVVWSRSLLIEAGNQTQPVLIPMLDECEITNFNENAKITFGDSAEDSDAGIELRVTSAEGLKAGDQLSINVGVMSNINLLLSHGKIEDDNPLDFVTMSIRMPRTGAWTEVKEKMLNEIGMSMNDTHYLRNDATEVPAKLLQMMRIHMMVPSEFDSHEESRLVGSEKNIFTLRNEHAVVKALLGSCDRLLELYGTSLTEDQAALESAISMASSLTTSAEKLTNARLQRAIKLRMAEKKIFLSTKLQLQQHWLDLLKQDTTSFSK